MALWTSSAALAASLFAGAGQPAAAQTMTSLGTPSSTTATNGVLDSVAYDDKHDVFLEVYESNHRVFGRFIASNNSFVGQAFEIGTHRISFAGQPRVAYTHHDDGADEFLVIYRSDANLKDWTNTFGQRVTFTGTGGALAGSFISISPNSGKTSLTQYPNDVAYNPVKHQFLASYHENGNIYIRPFNTDGTAAAAAITVADGRKALFDSRLAFDWLDNRWGVTFVGSDPAFTDANEHPGVFARVYDADTLQPTTGVLVLAHEDAIEPATAYLPERGGFLSTWTDFAPDRNVAGRFFSASGSIPNGIVGVMATPNWNEGAAALQYDPATRMVFVAAMRAPKNIAGRLLDGNGASVTSIFGTLTTVVPLLSGGGSFNPIVQVAKNGKSGVVYIIDYSTVYTEQFQVPAADTPGPECCNVEPPEPTPPTITAQPQSQTITTGQTATLSVGASGTAPFSYQWYAGSSPDTSAPIGGATSSSYVTPSLANTSTYWVKVTNSEGSANSGTATITVVPAPQAPSITVQPQNRTIGTGLTATLSVTATGTATLTYQWYKGSSPSTANKINGATGSTFTTPALSSTTSYWVQVKNGVGTANSSTATVTVSAFASSGFVPGDIDGDGTSDITIYRPGEGGWYSLTSSSGFTNTTAFSWGTAIDVPLSADFDADGKADPTFFRGVNGGWYTEKSASGYSQAFQGWGLPNDIPAPGDYDNDGITDLAIFRPSNGTWYVLFSNRGAPFGRAYLFGLSGDIPAVGDYDGDHKTDITLYRPSDHTWYVLLSSANFAASTMYDFGLATDVPVPGDYDGDGQTDLAVYRGGIAWVILTSSSGYTTQMVKGWGIAGDIAAPGDYDGDGKTDPMVFRPSTGTWYVLRSSTGGGRMFPYGQNGDVPVLGR